MSERFEIEVYAYGKKSPEWKVITFRFNILEEIWGIEELKHVQF